MLPNNTNTANTVRLGHICKECISVAIYIKVWFKGWLLFAIKYFSWYSWQHWNLIKLMRNWVRGLFYYLVALWGHKGQKRPWWTDEVPHYDVLTSKLRYLYEDDFNIETQIIADLHTISFTAICLMKTHFLFALETKWNIYLRLFCNKLHQVRRQHAFQIFYFFFGQNI